MSDIALNPREDGYRSRALRSLASQDYNRPRSGSLAVEHPTPRGELEPLRTAMGSVAFSESGIWPLERGQQPEFYRRIDLPLNTLTPRRASDMPGAYLKPHHRVVPGTILLTGGTAYRLYLYVGYCAWYPLHQDHLTVAGRNQGSRDQIAKLLQCLFLHDQDILIAGCALRAMLSLVRSGLTHDELRANGFYRAALFACGPSMWGRVMQLANGALPLVAAEQIAIGGPFSYSLLSFMNRESEAVTNARYNWWRAISASWLPDLARDATGLDFEEGNLGDLLNNLQANHVLPLTAAFGPGNAARRWTVPPVPELGQPAREYEDDRDSLDDLDDAPAGDDAPLTEPTVPTFRRVMLYNPNAELQDSD